MFLGNQRRAIYLMIICLPISLALHAHFVLFSSQFASQISVKANEKLTLNCKILKEFRTRIESQATANRLLSFLFSIFLWHS